MINPLEAVIQLLARDADMNALIEERVAAQHKFGDGWTLPSKALRVGLDGGSAELYVQWQRPRLEFWCYGESQAEALKVYLALVDLSRRTLREVVDTSTGHALVYWLNLVSGASLIRDPDTNLDVVIVYAEAAVAENNVAEGHW